MSIITQRVPHNAMVSKVLVEVEKTLLEGKISEAKFSFKLLKTNSMCR